MLTPTVILCPSISKGAASVLQIRRARIEGSSTPAGQRLDDREFVAAETGDHVDLPQATLEADGDDAQQFVAERMAERVVDLLEVVEIEAEKRETLAGFGGDEGGADALGEQGPVGEAGQGIVARHKGDLLLRLQPLGDVFVGGEPGAILKRPMEGYDETAIVHAEQLRDGLAPLDPRHDLVEERLHGTP